MGYRGPQKLLKKYSEFRQPSPDIPKENKKIQRQILRLSSEHPIFQFLSLPSLPYLCPGGYFGGRFPSHFCIDQYGGGFFCVSGRWSPLSQSEDFSALFKDSLQPVFPGLFVVKSKHGSGWKSFRFEASDTKRKLG